MKANVWWVMTTSVEKAIVDTMAMMSNERLRLLRHIHEHPERSVMALAKALGRQYRRVHDDVSILTEAGLLDRSGGGVRATADRIQATIEL